MVVLHAVVLDLLRAQRGERRPARLRGSSTAAHGDDAAALQVAADLWRRRVVERREDGEPALARRALLELGLHLLQFARGRAAQRCQDFRAQVLHELSGFGIHLQAKLQHSRAPLIASSVRQQWSRTFTMRER